MADTTYKSIHKGAQIDSAVTEVLNNLAGIQGVKVDDTELTPDTENKVNIDTAAFNIPVVVQETGTSTSSVMSQNAVTTAINGINIPAVVQQTGTSTTEVMSQNAVSNAIGDLVIPAVSQTTGTSTTSVMSQNSVTTNLALKAPLESPVFTGSPTGIVQTYTATLPSASWTGTSAPYIKAVAITGILATDKPDIDLDLSSATYSDIATIQSSWANVYRGVTSADTITFYASTVPTIDIPLGVKVVR